MGWIHARALGKQKVRRYDLRRKCVFQMCLLDIRCWCQNFFFSRSKSRDEVAREKLILKADVVAAAVFFWKCCHNSYSKFNCWKLLGGYKCA